MLISLFEINHIWRCWNRGRCD